LLCPKSGLPFSYPIPGAPVEIDLPSPDYSSQPEFRGKKSHGKVRPGRARPGRLDDCRPGRARPNAAQIRHGEIGRSGPRDCAALPLPIPSYDSLRFPVECPVPHVTKSPGIRGAHGEAGPRARNACPPLKSSFRVRFEPGPPSLPTVGRWGRLPHGPPVPPPFFEFTAHQRRRGPDGGGEACDPKLSCWRGVLFPAPSPPVPHQRPPRPEFSLLDQPIPGDRHDSFGVGVPADPSKRNRTFQGVTCFPAGSTPPLAIFFW